MADNTRELLALIPAGGAGTRLWPISRKDHPKFLSDLSGAGASLLEQTCTRLAPLTGEDGILIITGQAHREAVGATLELAEEQIICEPSGRDSLPAIALGAAIAYHRCREREGQQIADELVVASFAADHLIGDEPGFQAVVRKAITAARAGYITVIGITPDHPATGFGYIRRGQPCSAPGVAEGVYVCEQFVEKPNADLARQYVADGAYLWNAGMFVMGAKVFLDHLAQLMPADYERIMALAQAWDSPERKEAIDEHWEKITKIAIDHAIAEPVAERGGVAVVPADFDWNDVGDYLSLAQVNPAGDDGVIHLDVQAEVPALAIDSPGAFIASSVSEHQGKAVVVAGCPQIVVVQTNSTIFITHIDRAQKVKDVVSALDQAGMGELR